ncbi:MAG: hypothetical protein JXA73_23040 [Acidobacteria bacterium]|nr:hypothetical protein [Acidobacteriota bacterium]
MAQKIRKVDYFYIEAANKPGVGLGLLGALRDADINLLAFSGFPSGSRAQIDFVPENTAAFKAAAKKAGFKLSAKKTGFLIEGEDRIGALVNVMEKLAAARINITAIDAVTAGKGRYGAIFWVKAPDIGRAAKILRVS